MKKNIAIISGWFGHGEVEEYSSVADNCADFITELSLNLGESFNVYTQRGTIKEKKNIIDIEIHLNVQIPISKAKRICIYLEDISIRPQNIFLNSFNYNAVLTFDRDIAESHPSGYWILHPRTIPDIHYDFTKKRSRDFVLISTNRNLLFDKKNSLYDIRQELISFFESNHHDALDLYGAWWNLPFTKSGLISRVAFELNRKLNIGRKRKNKLKAWKGYIDSKEQALLCHDFNICIENKLGINGYVSEKIYDSFVYGSIPIYIPSSPKNSDIIPEDLYINPKDFNGFEDMFKYCKSLNSNQKYLWRMKMFEYIQSKKEQLSSKTFSGKVSKIIENI